MLIGIVTRFVAHKGIDLIQYIYEELMRREVQVVALGSGDYMFESFFQEMQARYPGKTAVKIGFIPDLARKIYAGADVFLMPSKSEPCGLAQMVSPAVWDPADCTGDRRAEGFDHRYGTQPGGEWIYLQTYNAHDMLGAIDRAAGLYYNREEWPKAVQLALACDFSWDRSASAYVDLYRDVLGQQGGLIPVL